MSYIILITKNYNCFISRIFHQIWLMIRDKIAKIFYKFYFIFSFFFFERYIWGRKPEILSLTAPYCFKVRKSVWWVDVLIQTVVAEICTILPDDWYVTQLPFHLFIHPSYRGFYVGRDDSLRDAILEIEPSV